MITAAHHQPLEIAPLARHAVQRLDAAHHRERGQQVIIGVHDELPPRALHGELLHGATVTGEPAVFDQAARLEMRKRFAIRGAVERHRQIEGIGAHAEIGAGERDTLAVTGKLELGFGGTQRRKADVAIAQDVHTPALHAAVHAPRHLQDLVGAEVHAREHVATAIDHVGETRVVDDDGVEPRHI